MVFIKLETKKPKSRRWTIKTLNDYDFEADKCLKDNPSQIHPLCIIENDAQQQSIIIVLVLVRKQQQQKQHIKPTTTIINHVVWLLLLKRFFFLNQIHQLLFLTCQGRREGQGVKVYIIYMKCMFIGFLSLVSYICMYDISNNSLRNKFSRALFHYFLAIL